MIQVVFGIYCTLCGTPSVAPPIAKGNNMGLKENTRWGKVSFSPCDWVKGYGSSATEPYGPSENACVTPLDYETIC